MRFGAFRARCTKFHHVWKPLEGRNLNASLQIWNYMFRCKFQISSDAACFHPLTVTKPDETLQNLLAMHQIPLTNCLVLLQRHFN